MMAGASRAARVEVDDARWESGPEGWCDGRQDSVGAMAMDARRRNEAGQALEGCETKFLATVPIGLGEPVHQASVR